MKLRWLVLAAITILGASAISLQFVGWRPGKRSAREPHLQQALPRVLDGVIIRDIPLGATEPGDEIVRRVLRCDEVVYRSYTTSRGAFEVLAIYWGANRIPSQLVASHTPDRCWSDNGWRCLQMRFQERFVSEGRSLHPGEWRIFESPGAEKKIHVIYWHMVGNTPYPYGRNFNWAPNPFRYWTQQASYVVFGSEEQYFVRLSSERPFEELQAEAEFRHVLDRLAVIALAERPQ